MSFHAARAVILRRSGFSQIPALCSHKKAPAGTGAKTRIPFVAKQTAIQTWENRTLLQESAFYQN